MASASASTGTAGRPNESPNGCKTFIAVMGATGSGKSSLISSITGKEGIVGHRLESETTDVCSHEVTIGTTTLVLVDTPGFDDTQMEDYQILHAVAAWLESSCDKGQLLSGLVYLHRITNTRMTGSAVRALHLFQRICGEENYKNVILATTFWNKLEHCKQEGIDREERLLANEGFWKVMKDKGAKAMRLAQDYKEIMPALMDMAKKPAITLEIQQELKDGIELEQTMAGLFVSSDNGEFQEEQEIENAKLKEGFAARLEQQQARFEAARRKKEEEFILQQQKTDLQRLEHKQQLMKQQLDLYQLNQRVKQAEIAARLREEEEMEAREREREAEEQRQRRQAQERESRQRSRLSLTQRTTVDHQIDLLRAAAAAGVAEIYVEGIDQEGIGMRDVTGTMFSVSRTGLNEWCDFCLKPYGLGQCFREYSPFLCGIDEDDEGVVLARED